MKFNLRCCGRENPIGVSRTELRLHFEVDGNEKVESYKIHIASSEENLKNGKDDVACFQGGEKDGYFWWPQPQMFSERTRYFWQVEALWGEKKSRSEMAYFETGIDEWSAEWIQGASSNGAVLNFRREFELTSSVKRAVLYICGLGYFDAMVNEKKLDASFYKPLVTDYAPRIKKDNEFLYENRQWRTIYYTYDVTEQLKKGKNVLSVDVANGYYCNTDKLYGEPDFSYGEPQLIYELYIQDADGEFVIKSDTQTMTAETEWNSTLYYGDSADFSKKGNIYQNAPVLRKKMGKLMSPQCQDDVLDKVFLPKEVKETEDGILYDFGMNHSGGLRFVAQAEEDTGIEIWYAEVLDEAGKPNYETSAWHGEDCRNGEPMDVYQRSMHHLVKGSNSIEPRFSWYCYRYVWIKKNPKVKIEQLCSLFIHTGVEQNGHMLCSEDMFNRLNETFIQTLFCNMHSGLITDCPHREKRPYTGDTNIVMKAALYNLDMVSFFHKWMDDVLDAQTVDGLIPNTAPNLGGGGGYAWGNAICTVAKELYCFTGDKGIIKKCYRAAENWLRYYKKNSDKQCIVRSNSHTWMLGDWLAPDMVESNVYYINTVCYYMATDAVVFLGEILGENTENWKNLRSSIAEGINAIFFKPEELSYGHGVQGEDMLALAVGIVPPEYEEALREKVKEHYSKETDYHLDTGIVLTPILISYLTDHGYRKEAYRIMTVKTYPSYYYLLEEDTTLSEHWSKKWPDYYIGDDKSRLVKGGGDLSHCHPMYGSVTAWLYERVAGLDLSRLYERKILIRPFFTEFLEWAEADKVLPYGKAKVKWKRSSKGLLLDVEIPQSLNGECTIPSSYKKITCLQTGEAYERAKDGCFHFEILSGIWSYQTEEEVDDENKKEDK